MSVRVGTDLIEIERIRRALARYARFRERCFTEAERAYCDSRPNPAQSYAGRFAGKEAVGKALGFGVARAFAWRDVEIVATAEWPGLISVEEIPTIPHPSSAMGSPACRWSPTFASAGWAWP